MPRQPRRPDAAQRGVAALAPDVSGVVVGAPGTGKTTALVDRVAALVAGGTSPDEIVVLTPSRATATALRDELGLAVGRPTAGPLARSVASFAWQLVRAVAVAAGDEPPQLLTGGDEDRIVADLLAGDAEDESAGRSRWPDWLAAPVRTSAGFRAEVRAFLATCTTLGIGPDALDILAEERGIPVWHALASFTREYRRVRDRMRGAHRDAAGLVREAVAIAARPDAPLLAGLRVVLVDDAQELTLGGVELVEACRARGLAVLVFGDPDVGSGSFRGATPANFARLARTLGIVATLDAPHRSTAPLADVVRTTTSRIGAVGVVAHRRAPAGAPPDGSVRVRMLRSPAEEVDAVARFLRERHLRGGVAWRDCAVIVHDARQVAAFETELSAREVPARATTSPGSLGAERAVRDLLAVVDLALRGAEDATDDDTSAVLTGLVGGLDAIGLRHLRAALRHEELAHGGVRGGLELLRLALAQPLELDLLDTREARRAARVARLLAELAAARGEGATAHELLWTAWEASGREREWAAAAAGHGPAAARAERDLDAVVALFQAAKRFGERDVAADAAVFVAGLLSSEVAEDRLDAPVQAEAVSVLTPAGALGREFDTVVVAGVQEGVWPNTRLRGGLLETWRLDAGEEATTQDRRRQALHDELRLFARAVSRARRALLVTAVDDDDTGPSALFELLPDPETPAAVGGGADDGHPLTLRGLVARHRRTLTAADAPDAVRRRAAGQLALLADARVPGAPAAEWYGVAPPSAVGGLRADDDAVRVSPSRLDALETCQLDWAIGDLGGDPGGVTAGLGTVLHAALEHAVIPDEAALWAAVEARWGELVFEAAWRERAERTRARDLVRRLSLYLARFEASGGVVLGAEGRFEVPVAGGPRDVVIAGTIDRVERTPAGEVVIVDLKTGKSEPQTDASVADHPQLGAYQLAFDAGAIPAASGLASGGAKLLVLRPTAKTKDYAEPRQRPFDDERRAAFAARILDAAAVMAGDRFRAAYEEHCRDEHRRGLCRIHTVGPVSAG